MSCEHSSSSSASIQVEGQSSKRLDLLTMNSGCSATSPGSLKRQREDSHSYDSKEDVMFNSSQSPFAKTGRYLEPKQSVKKPKSKDDAMHAVSPQEYMTSQLSKSGYQTSINHFSLESAYYFMPYREGEISLEVLRAVKRQDLELLQQLYDKEENAEPPQGIHHPLKTLRNFLGQSLLHISCRLGLQDSSDFLMNQVQIPLNIRDKFGRTPLHYACGATMLDLDLIRSIVSQKPELILFEDNFGYQPFSYIQQSCCKDCMRLLNFGSPDWWYSGLDGKYQRCQQHQI